MSGIEWTAAQRAVLESSGGTLVSASAGSGKTAVMLQKVISLLGRGYGINRLLIVTFSNASAAEMRDKLIQKLYDSIRAGQTHLKKQLELLNFSSICTIDSFCYSLYKSFFADLGLDPSFGLLEAQQAALLLNESIDAALESFFAKGDKAFLDLARRFARSRDVSPLKEAVAQVSAFLDVQLDERQFIERTAAMPAKKTLEEMPAIKFYLNHNRKMLRGFAVAAENLAREYGGGDRYKDILYNITTYINDIIPKQTITELSSALRTPTDFGALRGKQPEEKRALIKEIGALRDAVTKYLNGLRDELYIYKDGEPDAGMADIALILELTAAARELYSRQKERCHSLDFADLSRLALRILSDEERRSQVASRYDFIFVDEYQDTNYIQEEIITRVSGKDNLFAVGDPKQAIYQFRYAEPRIFLDRYHKYEQRLDGVNLSLNDNFRSDGRVLRFINSVFNELMDEEFGGVRYRNNAELVSGLDFPEVSALPAVEVAVLPKDSPPEKPVGVYSVKNAHAETGLTGQAEYIAAAVQRLAGREYIYDASLKTKRLIEYKDIAVLMYKRNAGGIIEQFRSRGIPYAAPGFKKSRLHEIDVLVDYLRIIDNMADDIPLSSVMQSPLGGFTVQDMLRIRKECPKQYFWESVTEYSGDNVIRDKIDKLFSGIKKLRSLAVCTDAAAVMGGIMASGYSSYLLSRGEETVGRVNNFINAASGKPYARDIPSFLTFFDDVYDDKDETASDGNAVRIMTIHSSKGLEFPVVFLANAQDGFTVSHDVKKDIYLDSEFGVAMKYFDKKLKAKRDTALTVSFKKKAHFREREELLRLMYVAMTRAKNHLFVTAEERGIKGGAPNAQDCFIQWIYAAAERNPTIKEHFKLCVGSESGVAEKTPVPQKESATAALAFEYPYKGADMPIKYTVTGLSDAGGGAEEKRSYLTAEERLARGTAYHAILQHISYNALEKDEIAAEIERLLRGGLIDAAAGGGVDAEVLRRVLNSDTLAYARKNKYMREQPFMLYLPAHEVLGAGMPADRVLVQGVIDLLILGETNMIVDFKVTQSGVEEIRRRYQKQLEIYALAAEKLLGIKIERRIIYEITRNLSIEV